MISSIIEYEAAQDELRHMQDWLARVERDGDRPNVNLTTAGILKMIARLEEELSEFETRQNDLKATSRSQPPLLVQQARVGSDGVPRLEIPLGASRADCDVEVTVTPIRKPRSKDDWRDFIANTAGKWQGELTRPE